MKERCKKYAGIRLDAFWKWVLLSVILALLIHVIFYFAAPVPFLEAKWGAGDLLSYISTIILAWIAYKQNERYKEDSEKFQEAQDKIASDTNEKFKQIQQNIEKQVNMLKDIEAKKLMPVFCIGAKLGNATTVSSTGQRLCIRLNESNNTDLFSYPSAHLKNLGTYGILNISCREIEIDGIWIPAKTTPEYFALDAGEVCLVSYPINRITEDSVKFRFEVTNILGELFHIEYELSREGNRTHYGKITNIVLLEN